MTNLALFVDAIEKGNILDAGPGSTPDQVADRIGVDYIDDFQRWRLRRDYGLVEFHFDGNSVAGLVCFGVTIQLHRMADVEHAVVPSRVRERYGELDRFVNAHDLTGAVMARVGKCEITREYTSTEFVSVRVGGTTAHIHEVRNPARVRDHKPGLGDVWSVDLGR